MRKAVAAFHDLHHAALHQVGWREVFNPLAMQFNAALGDFSAFAFEQIGNGAQRGGFASAIAAEQSHDAALGHLQGNAFQHEDHVVVNDLDAVDIQNNVGRTHGCVRFNASDQDWQSAPVRRVSFFSAAYLSAVALTSGFKICSSACIQSEVNSQALPFHV